MSVSKAEFIKKTNLGDDLNMAVYSMITKNIDEDLQELLNVNNTNQSNKVKAVRAFYLEDKPIEISTLLDNYSVRHLSQNLINLICDRYKLLGWAVSYKSPLEDSNLQKFTIYLR